MQESLHKSRFAFLEPSHTLQVGVWDIRCIAYNSHFMLFFLVCFTIAMQLLPFLQRWGLIYHCKKNVCVCVCVCVGGGGGGGIFVTILCKDYCDTNWIYHFAATFDYQLSKVAVTLCKGHCQVVSSFESFATNYLNLVLLRHEAIMLQN